MDGFLTGHALIFIERSSFAACSGSDLPDRAPRVGKRPSDGRSVYSPAHVPGIRMEPPISVPTPSGEPFMANSAASPPLLPPASRVRQRHNPTSNSKVKPTRKPPIIRIECAVPHIIIRLRNHHRGRDVRLAVDDSASLAQGGGEETFLLHGFVAPSNVSNRSVKPLHLEAILERHWQTVQRANRLPSLLEDRIELVRPLQRVLEADLCQAVDLLFFISPPFPYHQSRTYHKLTNCCADVIVRSPKKDAPV